MDSLLPPSRQFPDTSWTLLKHASLLEHSATAAMNEFVVRYYTAVGSFIRVLVRNPELAQDLTQEFFQERILSSASILGKADQSQGRFRPFLKKSIRNFLIDKHRAAVRRDQADASSSAPLEHWEGLQDADAEAADAALLREWGQSIVHLAIARVKAIAESKDQQQHFAMFAKRFLSDSDHPPSFRDVGRLFDLDEKTARGRVQTIVNHFRAQLEDLLKSDAGVDSDIQEEIRNLIALL